MEKVLRFFDSYVMPSWARVVGLLQATEAQAGVLRIAQWLQEKKPETVCPSDITRLGWRGLRRGGDVAPLLAELEHSGWLLPAPKAAAVGRPPTARPVNPRIHEVGK